MATYSTQCHRGGTRVREWIDGFAIASLITVPPMYEPGGRTALIDDFTVADPQSWDSIGRWLFERLKRRPASEARSGWCRSAHTRMSEAQLFGAPRTPGGVRVVFAPIRDEVVRSRPE